MTYSVMSLMWLDSLATHHDISEIDHYKKKSGS